MGRSTLLLTIVYDLYILFNTPRIFVWADVIANTYFKVEHQKVLIVHTYMIKLITVSVRY